MIEASSYELHGTRVLDCSADGSPVSAGGMVTELIGAAWGQHARLVLIPIARLGEDFFQLKTGVAGEMLQKLATYDLRVAIVGDIGRRLAESSALHDFVVECNRGSQIWFVASLDELDERLKLHEQGL